MKQLSQRLQSIANQVPGDRILVDVGTDHAYLPIYLVQKGVCPQAIGVDVHTGPIQSAREQVALAGLSKKIRLQQGDGFKGLVPQEAQVGVIAGMGGKNICEILSASPAFAEQLERLILQPMKGIARVRQWLQEHNWSLVYEDLVLEDGQYYLILTAEPQSLMGSARGDLELNLNLDQNFLEWEVGPYLFSQQHPLLPAYLQSLIAQEERILHNLKQSKSVLRTQVQIEQRTRRIQQLTSIIHQLADKV